MGSGASLRTLDRRRVDNNNQGRKVVKRPPPCLPSRALSSTVLATMFSSSMLMLCGATAWVTAAAAVHRAPGGPTPHLLPLPSRQLHSQINPPKHRPPPPPAAQSRRGNSTLRLRFVQQRYPLTARSPTVFLLCFSSSSHPSFFSFYSSLSALKLLSERTKKDRLLTLLRFTEMLKTLQTSHSASYFTLRFTTTPSTANFAENITSPNLRFKTDKTSV